MAPTEQPALARFRCNICGAVNERPPAPFGREVPSCDGCGSSVRTRALVRMLAREIFGADIAVPDFPVLKSLRGIGMSDTDDFAARLAAKFDYRNTHYDKAPRLDVLDPAPADIGAYDFIVSSEVLEHVVAPVGRAFGNLFRMLKPNGLLLMTVPYGPEGDLREHFGPMSSFALAEIDGRTILVRRSAAGEYEVLDNLVFHGGHGSTLEMRVFSDSSIREHLAGAGFEVRVYTEDAPAFGIVHNETWSLPIAGRKGEFAFGPETRAEWCRQWLARPTPAPALPEAGGADDELRHRLNQRNADAQALVAEFDRRMAAANARIDELTATVQERDAQGRAVADQLADAQVRIAGLEALLRERLFSRIKRKLGLLPR